MEKLSDETIGYSVVKVSGAYPEEVLNRCAAKNIEFWGVNIIDELTLELRTRLGMAEDILAFADRCGCEIEIIRNCGIPPKLKLLRYRPLLVALPLFFLGFLIFSSFFIWKIEISGNETVSDTEILNALEESGVYLGCSRPSITSDLVRSRVMVQIPELKWVGVSVFGSRVRVQVREASLKPEIFDTGAAVKIVAARAGIIENITALQGFPMFRNGETAVEGDTLIDSVIPSSLADSRIVHAKGSVFAKTWYEISAIMPIKYSEKVYTGKTYRQYALEVGKRRINFYRSSRILGNDCDIIISEHDAGIKGLFSLPITLVCIKCEPYEMIEQFYTEYEIKTALQAALEKQLKLSIGKDGTIDESTVVFSTSGDFAVATLRAQCEQDIAREKELTQLEIDSAKQPKEEISSE